MFDSPTLKEIRKAHSWKRDYEKYMPTSRFLFRPAAFLATWLAIRIGLTSEAVSWLSAVIGLLGCAILVSGDTGLILIGVAFLVIFNLLDCVDGSIARVMKTENPYGRFLDSTCGEMVDVIFWAVIGILAYQHNELLRWPDVSLFGASLWLITGIAASFLSIQVNYMERTFDELLRCHWEKTHWTHSPIVNDLPNLKAKAPPDHKIIPLRIIINNNMRVRENHYVLLIIALLMKSIDIFLFFYFLYYLFLYIVLLITYSRRGRIVRRNILSHHSDDKKQI